MTPWATELMEHFATCDVDHTTFEGETAHEWRERMIRLHEGRGEA